MPPPSLLSRARSAALVLCALALGGCIDFDAEWTRARARAGTGEAAANAAGLLASGVLAATRPSPSLPGLHVTPRGGALVWSGLLP